VADGINDTMVRVIKKSPVYRFPKDPELAPIMHGADRQLQIEEPLPPTLMSPTRLNKFPSGEGTKKNR
jgi:hypothetical protein